VVNNSEADYRSRITAARRMRRLADAGRVQEIEVDQAVQSELQARRGWIRARQSYKSQLDAFKDFLDLPVDARIKLDPNELTRLGEQSQQMIESFEQQSPMEQQGDTPPADAPIKLAEPTKEDAGPYEFPEDRAIELALENRLDFKVSRGQIYDAQRAVIVAADALNTEITLGGNAAVGSSRSVSSADMEDARTAADDAFYSALLTVDLPFERTAEALDYRESYITLEQQVRDYQKQEDQIKLSIRNQLRDMLEARENVTIQAMAVYIARKRVDSVNMFLEAGRAETRDLLEAQDALLSAQNALSSAVVNYRIAELNIQRDMGVLEIKEQGLWQEYKPGESDV
jgi:outer membrane protein TolC